MPQFPFGTTDIAVLCSGDADLQKSVEEIKSLGKQIIIASRRPAASIKLQDLADFFIELRHLEDRDLEKFTKVHKSKEKKEEINNSTLEGGVGTYKAGWCGAFICDFKDAVQASSVHCG